MKIKDIPRIAKEFDTNANPFKIDNITSGSNKTVFWVCSKGHKWGASPSNRVAGKNCPYCAGRRPIIGENDLATVFPEVAKEWHPTKNGNAKPEDFKSQSNKKMWWLCPKGHEYESQINLRTIRGYGCPYCCGRYARKGETDLESQRPDIAKDWHPIKNGEIKPDSITVSSSHKYWWLCPNGHEYEMSVDMRTLKSRANGCPYCSGKKAIAGENDLGTVCEEANRFWDYDKNDTTPNKYLPYSGAKIWMKCDKGHSWQVHLFNFVRNPKCPYCNGTRVENNVNTLRALYPEIAQKWNYERNGNIDINTIHVGSCTKKYWWKCEKGHEWITDVAHMVKSKGRGCPYCAGHISKYSI